MLSLSTLCNSIFSHVPPTLDICPLSLHDALPICPVTVDHAEVFAGPDEEHPRTRVARPDGVQLERQQARRRSEEHTSEIQSPDYLLCSLLLEKKNTR